MTWNSKVIWSEGMFLQPQHFQQQDRYFERLIESRIQPLAGNGWGFSQLAIDSNALMMGKVALTRADGLLADGTPFACPADVALPEPLSIPGDVKDELVVLGLALRRRHSLEVRGTDTTGSLLVRFRSVEAEVADNSADAAQTAALQVGQLQLRLMLARECSNDYATLGVARIVERRADNQVVLDSGYIPPTLVSRQDPLLAGFCKEILGLLHQRGEALASRLAQPGRGGVAEISEFVLLQVINRFEPLFAHLAQLGILHPEQLYGHSLALAGELASFSSDRRRPPEYPVYRHDELDKCFGPLIRDLRRSLSTVIDPHAIAIELQQRKFGVYVAIIPDIQLLTQASFVLAVNAQLAGDALRARFPAQVKLGPVEKIRELVNLQLPGIALRPLPVAPRQIPYHSNFNYFELERGSELWKQLEHSGGLAMHVAGEFPGLEMEFWAIKR
jgi:type VI secretion system protein ImpJ